MKTRAAADKLLRDSGFSSIEYPNGDLKSPPAPAHVKSNTLAPSDYEAQGEYYRLAGVFLHEHAFTSVTERRVWELHSDGVAYCDIVKQAKVSMRLVKRTVQTLRGEMLSRTSRSSRDSVTDIYRELARLDYETLLLIAPTILKRGKE